MRPDELIGILPHSSFASAPGLWQSDFLLEMAFWAVVGLLTLALLIWRPETLSRIEAFCVRLSWKPRLAVGLTIFSALIVRAALLPLLPIPDPIVHDEYSYLLGAQTFAACRLTNPTPPMWVHFETFHVNMVPTYQSMYPPAQALLLAIPLVLHIHPWWAVWASIALMCGTVCWMLKGWMPPQWALLGGLLCVVRFATFSYWMNSYWGGALAAIGGALVLGALPRIKRSQKPIYPLLLALGLAILANSRAYEGFVFSVPALGLLLFWFAGAGRKRTGRVVGFAPAAALLLVVIAGMAYYNWRGTGNPLLMPYQANQAQYHITRPFLWQARNPIPHYHHQVMRTRYVFHELPDYLNRGNPEVLFRMFSIRIHALYDFYLWPLAIPVLLTLGTAIRSKRIRPVLLSIVALLAGLAVEQWGFNPHYAAPMLCATVAMSMYALRVIRTWKLRSLPLGPMLVQATVIGLFCWTLLPLAQAIINPFEIGVFAPMPPPLDRVRLTAQLDRMPGQHLVFVHNRMSANGIYDWVYNEPDMENAKIVWARDMGTRNNAELVRYYSGRHTWVVDQDDGIMRLNPYDGDDREFDPARVLNIAAGKPGAVPAKLAPAPHAQ